MRLLRELWRHFGIAFMFGVCVAALLFMLWLVKAASAHSWYPIECCGGYDCGEAVVTMVAAFPADAMPHMMVSVNGMTALVPDNMPRLVSKDGKTHACIRHEEKADRLLCIFLPPST